MQEESGQESGGEGCDALFQPSSLLTGLPSLACVQLLQALVASGSRQLTELMTACKATRSMVVQHAPRIRFTEHGPSQVASMAHAALHAAATRSGCDLELVFNFQGVTGRASALLSAAATQGISPSNAGAGSPAGRGCCAVHSLTIKVGRRGKRCTICKLSVSELHKRLSFQMAPMLQTCWQDHCHGHLPMHLHLFFCLLTLD